MGVRAGEIFTKSLEKQQAGFLQPDRHPAAKTREILMDAKKKRRANGAAGTMGTARGRPVERRASNNDAVKRFRGRSKGDTGEWCQKLDRGRPRTRTPSRRTIQRRAAEICVQMHAAGLDGDLAKADTKRYQNMVMAACQQLPRSQAAQVGFVVQGSAEEVRTGARKKGKMPRVSIRLSSIPGAGAGVFAEEDVPKNEVLTEYWGRLKDRKEALKLREEKKDTHLRTMGFRQGALDGRITEEMRIEDYLEGHRVGSFINCPPEGVQANCEYIVKEWDGGAVRNGSVFVAQRVFLQTTRAVLAGEELFVKYGRTYESLHLAE
jgi:hypothetical protein